MNDINDELLKEAHEEGASSSLLLPIFIALFVIMMALFIGEMLFGKNSLEVYLALQNDESKLEKKIYKLKNENASLQKNYFELKNIMPSQDE